MPDGAAAGGVRRFFDEYRHTWNSTGPAGRGFLAGGIVYLMRAIGYSVAFPLYAKERGYSPGDIGLFLAASGFALFLLGVPITLLGGRGFARKALVAGPTLAGFGILLILLAPDGAKWMTVAGALLSGAGGASFWVLGDPLLAATTPISQRAHVYALKFFVVTIGVALGGGLGGWIPGVSELLGASPYAALVIALSIFAVLDLVQSLMFARIPPYEPPVVLAKRAPDQPRAQKTSRAWLPWAVMIALSVPELGMAFGHNSIRPFLSLFFDEVYGLSASSTGTILAVLGLLGGVGSLAGPKIAARLGNLPAIAVLRITGGTAIVLWFTGIGLPPILVCMFVYYVIMDGTEAIFITEAMQRLPISRRTWFSGIYAMAWSLASTGASLTSGFVQDRNDGAFGMAFILGACGYLFSVVWMLAVIPRLPVITESD